MAGKKSYFMALVPPRPLAAEITQIKEVFFETYGARHALNTVPHITLVAPFWAAVSAEDALFDKMPGFALRYPVFPIELDGFGSFDRPGHPVIFIRVLPGDRLLSLREELLRFMERNVPGAAADPSPSFHPHITIAHRDLPEEAYRESNALYQKKAFHALFAADGITLFKHDGSVWQPIRHAPFSPVKK